MLKIRHTGIYVNDLQLMKDFYTKNFCMRESCHDIEDSEYISNLYGENYPIKVELYKLETKDGCMIELLKLASGDSKNVHSDRIYNKGCSHIAFTVENIDDKYNQLISQGIQFCSPPIVDRDERHKVCICRDPEGNYMELVEEL